MHTFVQKVAFALPEILTVHLHDLWVLNLLSVADHELHGWVFVDVHPTSIPSLHLSLHRFLQLDLLLLLLHRLQILHSYAAHSCREHRRIASVRCSSGGECLRKFPVLVGSSPFAVQIDSWKIDGGLQRCLIFRNSLHLSHFGSVGLCGCATSWIFSKTSIGANRVYREHDTRLFYVVDLYEAARTNKSIIRQIWQPCGYVHFISIIRALVMSSLLDRNIVVSLKVNGVCGPWQGYFELLDRRIVLKGEQAFNTHCFAINRGKLPAIIRLSIR